MGWRRAVAKTTPIWQSPTEQEILPSTKRVTTLKEYSNIISKLKQWTPHSLNSQSGRNQETFKSWIHGQNELNEVLNDLNSRHELLLNIDLLIHPAQISITMRTLDAEEHHQLVTVQTQPNTSQHNSNAPSETDETEYNPASNYNPTPHFKSKNSQSITNQKMARRKWKTHGRRSSKEYKNTHIKQTFSLFQCA